MSKLKLFLAGARAGIRDFSIIITDIVNFVLLSIVYFIGVGAVAIVSKMAGKSFLNLKSRKKSTWVERNLSKRPIEEYYRGF